MTRLAFLLLALLAGSAAAADTPAAVLTADHSTAEIYLGQQSDGGRWLALRIVPEEGWHTYWRNPGDSGAAPIVDWGQDGIDGPFYPTPERLPVAGLMTYGYEGPVTLLFRSESALPERLDVFAEWLVCKDICIPQMAQVSVATDQEVAPGLIARARTALPQPSLWPAEFTRTDGRVHLTLFAEPEDIADIREAYFFPADGMTIDYAAMQTAGVSADGFTLSMPIAAGAQIAESLTGVVKIERLDGSVQGWQVQAPVVTGSAPVGVTQETPSTAAPLGLLAFLGILASALAGGVILNLMPCVFPVLSLKALALVHSRGMTERAARVEGLAYGAGVISSFLLVAGLLLVLKGAGQAVGWGFHLQDPLVVTALAVVLFLVGLNLTGWFEVSGRLAGVGQGLTAQSGPRGAFFTGVLATVVATPCTAPFMATALGFALTQPAAISLLVFAFLGLGLALPVLLISFIPALRRLMPKPGAWMDTFKQALAFPMFLAAIWMVWVLGQLAGPDAVVAALIGMLIVAFAIWLSKLGLKRRGSQLAAVSLVAAAIVSWLVVAADLAPEAPAAAKARAGALVYDTADLAQLRQQGRPVFVYFTAAWCITCKVNERVALNTPAVQDFLAQQEISVMVGDWTARDPEIAETLEAYGRSGVPLYLFFPAGGDAVILPQVLTADLVVTTLSAARTAG
ncbi:MAG: protein-disulfide reductase DsbD family protein [Rhodothalassiaceae bacterium]